ncbi:MAG: nucleotidyltransferase family protein [Deltaproteobacteria bacterium]|nr:nucleotidyltransferase family protein [Deltaproteobacteria bacterium]
MIVGVVLAAGGSSRMGRPKQLLPFGRGTLVQAALRPFLAASSVERVIVVVGHRAEAVARAVAIDQRVTIVENRRWREGMASSIRAAMRWVPPRTDAILLGLGDQPRVPVAVVERLCAGFRAARPPAQVLIPTFHGRRGHPVLFAGGLRKALLTLDGDQGARGLIRGLTTGVQEVPVQSPGILYDCDTPEEYAALAGAPLT